MNFLAIFLGGGLGALCRYIATLGANKFLNTPIFGTFFVNILGCFLIGYIFALSQKSGVIPPNLKAFLTVGFLGGLTTFSTFSLEAFCFLKEEKFLYFLIYVLSSFLIGLLALALGIFFAKSI